MVIKSFNSDNYNTAEVDVAHFSTSSVNINISISDKIVQFELSKFEVASIRNVRSSPLLPFSALMGCWKSMLDDDVTRTVT